MLPRQFWYATSIENHSFVRGTVGEEEVLRVASGYRRSSAGADEGAHRLWAFWSFTRHQHQLFSHLLYITAARRSIKTSLFRLVLNVISGALALSKRGSRDILAFLLEDKVPATPLSVSCFLPSELGGLKGSGRITWIVNNLGPFQAGNWLWQARSPGFWWHCDLGQIVSSSWALVVLSVK